MGKDGFSATRKTHGGKGDQSIGTIPEEKYNRIFRPTTVDGLSEKDNNIIEDMISTIKQEKTK